MLSTDLVVMIQLSGWFDACQFNPIELIMCPWNNIDENWKIMISIYLSVKLISFINRIKRHDCLNRKDATASERVRWFNETLWLFDDLASREVYFTKHKHFHVASSVSSCRDASPIPRVVKRWTESQKPYKVQCRVTSFHLASLGCFETPRTPGPRLIFDH